MDLSREVSGRETAKRGFLVGSASGLQEVLFVFIYTILVAVLSPESPKFVETVSNVTLAGVILYLIVFYACVAMLLAVYFYPVVKEKIGESPSFVKRFAFIVGIQTVLFSLKTCFTVMLQIVCYTVQDNITILFLTVMELEWLRRV